MFILKINKRLTVQTPPLGIIKHWSKISLMDTPVFNPLTPGEFWKKRIFGRFWHFLYQGPTFSKRNLQHEGMPSFALASRFMTFLLGQAQKASLFHIFLYFCCSCWPSTWLACSSRISERAPSKQEILAIEEPAGWLRQILLQVFHSNFQAFLWVFQAQLTQSLLSGHHWKKLFLQRRLSINVFFDQRWWRHKWNKGQRSSRPILAGTGANGLVSDQRFLTIRNYHSTQRCVALFSTTLWSNYQTITRSNKCNKPFVNLHIWETRHWGHLCASTSPEHGHSTCSSQL